MRLTLTILLLALWLCQTTAARAAEIALLSSLEGEHRQRYHDTLARALAPAGLHRIETSAPAAAALLIAAGARACEQSLAQTETPVLCTFVTQTGYARMAPQARALHHSALYLDQPLARHFNLARLLLPPEAELAVLLETNGARPAADLLSATAAAGVKLSVLHLATGRNPASLIQQSMDRGQTLLALPHPRVYNRQTIHGILLTTYRKGIAVIGFSESFVRAGAIAAVHSTPEDLAHASAEAAASFLAGGETRHLPPPAHPSHFTVSLNRRVARSLSINLPPEARLHQQLIDMESGIR